MLWISAECSACSGMFSRVPSPIPLGGPGHSWLAHQKDRPFAMLRVSVLTDAYRSDCYSQSFNNCDRADGSRHKAGHKGRTDSGAPALRPEEILFANLTL